MKTKVADELELCNIGKSSMQGRQLVQDSDGMDHVIYQIVLEANKTHRLISPFGEEYNHVYYFLSGHGDAKTDDGSVLKMTAHSVLAMTGDMGASYHCERNTCLIAVFTCCDPNGDKFKVTTCRLDDIVDTERDVDWTTGRSRRFLNKIDGFNLTITNTTADAYTKSNLEYKNHFETVIWYHGKGNYQWDEGKMKQEFDLQYQNDDDANLNLVAMVMNKHDAHVVNIEDKKSFCVCVFSPALIGRETHNLNDTRFSSY